MTAPLALTLGDPAGCGPSITQQAWLALRDQSAGAFYLRAPEGIVTGIPVTAITSPAEAAEVFPRALPLLATGSLTAPLLPGTPDTAHAPAIIASIEAGVSDVRSGAASAIVTNPISKSVLARAGFAHPGHTEFLAELCAGTGPAPRPVMMLVGGGLRVALATIHMPLRSAIEAIRQDLLLEIGEITHGALRRDFGVASPRLVFTGLNPHAGEDGLLGKEEAEIINPAAHALRQRGIDMANARPADTVFAEMLEGRFDAVIAMTHDQGLIPVKTLDIWGGVNTTLGLPIIRTSPDHGTAYDAAAAGKARPDSLIAAIRLAAEMARARSANTDG